MEEIRNYEVLQVTPTVVAASDAGDRLERANVDVQVATAHRFPRNLTRTLNNAIAIATMNKDTAQSMGYALPRGNKPIMGPSIHLARILAQQYGNIRAEAKVVEITDRQVISRGTAWDLENNTAVSYEVRRSIINSKGQRYNDDMITVTGNAANAIAYRNAVFNIIPHSLIDSVYRAAQGVITGDLSDEVKLIQRRQGAIKHFNDQYGITEDEVVKLCGKQTPNQIGPDQIALLLGVAQALKDGDTTVEEVMASIRGTREAKNDKLTDLARQAAQKTKDAAANAKPAQAEAKQENVDKATGEVQEAAEEQTPTTETKA